MKDHLAYLKYVLRHKLYVFQACLKMKVPIYRSIIHDYSKFTLSEWKPYVKTFYKPDGSKQYVESPAFEYAWNHHQKSNKHHWQYWLLSWDRGETVALEMPETYVREMLADWIGAGWAIKGKPKRVLQPLYKPYEPFDLFVGVKQWYNESKDKMILHPKTRIMVEQFLSSL